MTTVVNDIEEKHQIRHTSKRKVQKKLSMALDLNRTMREISNDTFIENNR